LAYRKATVLLLLVTFNMPPRRNPRQNFQKGNKNIQKMMEKSHKEAAKRPIQDQFFKTNELESPKPAPGYETISPSPTRPVTYSQVASSPPSLEKKPSPNPKRPNLLGSPMKVDPNHSKQPPKSALKTPNRS
jgi:hypothetical protein